MPRCVRGASHCEDDGDDSSMDEEDEESGDKCGNDDDYDGEDKSDDGSCNDEDRGVNGNGYLKGRTASLFTACMEQTTTARSPPARKRAEAMGPTTSGNEEGRSTRIKKQNTRLMEFETDIK